MIITYNSIYFCFLFNVGYDTSRETIDGLAGGRNNFEGYSTKRVYSVVGKTRALVTWSWIIELDYGKNYRKALYLVVKTMVSCKFSLKSIQWLKLKSSGFTFFFCDFWCDSNGILRGLKHQIMGVSLDMGICWSWRVVVETAIPLDFKHGWREIPQSCG